MPGFLIIKMCKNKNGSCVSVKNCRGISVIDRLYFVSVNGFNLHHVGI